MSDIQKIEQEIKVLKDQLQPLNDRILQLSGVKRDLESREFIRVNGIKKSDVEFSDYVNDGTKPYFWHITDFIKWIRDNSSKNWVEWNHKLYRASDLLNDRMVATKGISTHLED